VKRIAPLVALLTMIPLLAGCDSRRVDPLRDFASASCGIVQSWVDAVEDLGKDLSTAVTHIDRPSARIPYYEAFAEALHERADDTVRQLRHVAPRVGDGKDAADVFITALMHSEEVTVEIKALAATFPRDDRDDEDVYSRVASLFVSNEKAFSYPTRALDELAKRYDAFATVPSCVDYNDPVT
jgi:hypothetical protein